MRNPITATLLVTLLLSACVNTGPAPQPRETAMLKPVAGYQGNRLNTTVVSVDRAAENSQRIELMLPDLGTDIQSVKVKDASGKVVRQTKPFEIINDPDNNRQGVIIYLDEKQERRFKINFNDQPDY